MDYVIRIFEFYRLPHLYGENMRPVNATDLIQFSRVSWWGVSTVLNFGTSPVKLTVPEIEAVPVVSCAVVFSLEVGGGGVERCGAG